MTPRETTGRRFGRYILRQSLAKGGMAEIFLADMEAAAGIKKQVVVKRILPTFADDERFVTMFIDEAAITVKLSHGNVAQVFDFGEIGGEYFLAMEYIRGQSLSAVVRRAASKGLIIPPHIACYVVMEMCKGLHYAHCKREEGEPLGIVHRDVSPQNVMISYEGQVKLVDFGIAKARNVASKTRAGAVKGKYLYFSPEQARGRAVDSRTDVFAAGIVLYELITGRLPFKGQLIDVLRGIVEGRFEPPSSLVPEMKPSLEKIILKAMAKVPEERYQTAHELQEALAAYLFSVAPRFTGSGVAHYMRYLYQEELTSQGISVDLPSDFLEQLPMWRSESGEPEAPDPSTENTDPDIEGVEQGTASEATWEKPPSTTSPGRRQKPVDLVRRRRHMQVLGAAAVTFGVIATIAFAAVYATRALAPPPAGAGLVVVETTPPGATVRVDGEMLGVTPVVLDRLSPGRMHAITLRLEGHRDAWRTVAPTMEGPTTVSVTLEELSRSPEPLVARDPPTRQRGGETLEPLPPTRETVTPEGMDAFDRIDRTLQHFLTGAAGGEERAETIHGRVPLRRASTDIRDLPALRVPLDRARGHELRLLGRAFLGDPLYTPPSSDACWLASYPDGRLESGVVRGSDPVRIEAGAAVLFLIIPDLDSSANEGRLTVRVTPDEGETIERSLDVTRHVFDPRRHGATVLSELSIVGSYRARLSPDPPAAPLFYVVERLPGLGRSGAGARAFGPLHAETRLRGASTMVVFSLTAGRRPPAESVEIELLPQ